MTHFSYKQAFFSQLKKDLKVQLRYRSELLNPLVFVLMSITLFILAVGPYAELLTRVAPAILWLTALFSTLLGLDKLFRNDHQNGALEQLTLSPFPLALLLSAKVWAHWILASLPVVLLTPLFGLLLKMNSASIQAAMLTLLLGTPILSFIGAIGAALIVRLERGGVLLTLLVMPLYMPVLIFATGIIDLAQLDSGHVIQNSLAQLALLAAMFIATVILAPVAMAAAIKISH